MNSEITERKKGEIVGMVIFYEQVTTAGYKKKSFKSKSLWKREVGRAKLIKTGLANDGQHHVGAEMECRHKSLTQTHSVLSWECVSSSFLSIKGTNNLHVAVLQKCDMWSVNPFSSHPTVFSQSRDGVQVGGEGEEKSGEKESF